MKPARKYHITFNVTPDKKMIEAIAVTLDKEFIRDPNTQFRVDLSDHPLYPALEAYVLANSTQIILSEAEKLAICNLIRVASDETTDVEEGAKVPIGTLDALRDRIKAAFAT